MTQPLQTKTWLLYILLLTAICATAYSGTLDLPLDLHGPAPATEETDHSSRASLFPGQPIAGLVFSIGSGIWGESAWAFRVLAIVLHISVAFVTAWALAGLGMQSAGLLAGLLFAAGVGHYHAVQWVTGFPFAIVVILGWWIIRSFDRYASGGQPQPLVIACVATVLAVLTHPAACVFPLIAVSVVVRDRRSILEVVKPGGILFAIGLIALFIVRLVSPASDSVTTHLGDPIRLVATWLSYLGSTVLTSHILVYPDFVRGGPSTVVVGVVVIGAVWVSIRSRATVPAAGLLWMALAAMPFAGADSGIVESRYLYLPAVGFAIVLGWAVSGLGRTASYVATAVLVILSMSQVQSSVAIAHASLARQSLASGRYEEARDRYRLAHETAPDLLTMDDYVRLTKAHFYVGEIPLEAIDDAQSELSDPDLILKALSGVCRLASASLDSHRVGQTLLNEALTGSLRPDVIRDMAAGAFLNLGVHRYQVEDYLKAGEAFSYAGQMDTERLDILVWKARSLWKGGLAQESAETVFKMLDESYREDGGPREAVSLLHEMIKEDQWETGLWRLLAMAYVESKRYDRASWAMIQAIALVSPDPNDLEFLKGIADSMVEKEGPLWAAYDFYRSTQQVKLDDEQLSRIRSAVTDEIMLKTYDDLASGKLKDTQVRKSK